MVDFMERAGGNPGRSGHRLSVEAARVVYDAREAVAELFAMPDPLRVVFTLNATYALNTVIKAVAHPGDRVVTTGIEHNAAMRPLRALEAQGAILFVVPCHPDGTLDLEALAEALKQKTRLVVVNHASNVSGTLAPVAEVVRLAHAAGALVLIDAAQTAGTVPISFPALGADFLAFTGHKGLLGPPGTGGLLLSESCAVDALEPLVRGGTGSRSESEVQPDELPDRFESGTPNGAGLAGLGAGVRWVLAKGVDAIRAREIHLARLLREGLASIPDVTVYGPADPAASTAVVSFTAKGHRVSEIGFRLDEEHGVLCRVGLHCAPAAHRTLGTFPEGTVRFAPGVFTSDEDCCAAVAAVAQVLRA